ncbi:hypothetical protein A3A64_03160 [Candidatus Gottesmanbacteria bacterium RIFCSPLOWO2_01_FULL_48_11]|uniref:Uncharacterized protein n=1 Tax=Candidatus Gottesmanbacteria bacterium RIFCSPLOWO2_01_FULL_48_11 TaxID=1798395 RepID=A0A1F6ATX0_9BACT|nr:MAG: hypothetical protein A3A64_03160 [Candidatus Gottesmanbacteria bacterium RIFCSPLOWO2_01_FULL_48_11]
MDFQSPGVTYILLVIPAIFSLAVIGQGIYKVTKQESDGGVVVGFGVVFLALIAAAYFLFIQ